MKKTIFLCFVLFVQMTWACNCLNFKEAQEKALRENKFLLVHFSNSFYMNDKGEGIMFLPSFNDEANKVSDDYIFVCVLKRDNSKLIKTYNITKNFDLLILDPNGFELFRFGNDVKEEEIYYVLTNLVIPKDFFQNDLNNYHEKCTYNSALRIVQKYFDYTLLTDAYVESNIISVADEYLKKAENELSKKDKNYKEKRQKLELFKLFHWAYSRSYEILNEKINFFPEKDIDESNQSIFYFLKYLSSKALKNNDFAKVENKVKDIDGFDYFISKTDLILAKKVEF